MDYTDRMDDRRQLLMAKLRELEKVAYVSETGDDGSKIILPKDFTVYSPKAGEDQYGIIRVKDVKAIADEKITAHNNDETAHPSFDNRYVTLDTQQELTSTGDNFKTIESLGEDERAISVYAKGVSSSPRGMFVGSTGITNSGVIIERKYDNKADSVKLTRFGISKKSLDGTETEISYPTSSGTIALTSEVNAIDASAVHNTGDESISGTKTFTTGINTPTLASDSTSTRYNGKEVAVKEDVAKVTNDLIALKNKTVTIDTDKLENYYLKSETYNKNEVYNKEEVDAKTTAIYRPKGSVQTYEDLPTENNEVGDVYNVVEAHGSYPAGTNYVWTAENTWDALGGSIDTSNLVDLSSNQTISGNKDFTGTLTVNGNEVATAKEAQKLVLLGADGVEETGAYDFTVQDAESYLPYKTTGTKFTLDLHLPVVGNLTLNKKVAITFGDTTYYLHNILKGKDTVTIGDLHQVDKYNNATGYRFIFDCVYFETTDLVGFYIIPTVSMSDVLSLNSDEMDDYLADGGLTQGQIAVCNKVITNGYEVGHLYRFDITYPATYAWTELTSGGGLTVLRQSDFPLSADLLAKVKANPQNYCLSLKNDYSQDETFYYNRTTSTEIQYLGYYTTQYIVNALTHIGAEIRLSDGSLSVKVGNSVLFHIQSATNDFGIDKNTIRTIGVFAKTNNQTLSGDDIYLATTIDIGDDD